MPRKRTPLAIVYDFDGTLASGRLAERAAAAGDNVG